MQDKEVQSVQKLVPYKIVEGTEGAAWVDVQGNKMSPSQVMKTRGWVYIGRTFIDQGLRELMTRGDAVEVRD